MTQDMRKKLITEAIERQKKIIQAGEKTKQTLEEEKEKQGAQK